MIVEAVAISKPLVRTPDYGVKYDRPPQLPGAEYTRRMTAEELMVYCARVSSPHNQGKPGVGLLKYCLEHGHWSVFEQADLTVEIQTSRAIAAQILRHRSFTFQEFSQRYSVADLGFQRCKARRQDTKNRQNSIDDLPSHTRDWWDKAQSAIADYCSGFYQQALEAGIAKEQARFLLPLSTTTRLYMKGTVRSWIHYLQVRDADGVQREHQEIAHAIKGIFMEHFPHTSEALGWKSSS